ncbi:hypothetical protein [Pseudomonas sp. S32]|uniref:hypothetical protein n=1 Tax=Pseudomonas sp. S32 TaxID=2767448 RepID=UPI0019144D84|nr:hypothetical protein [Pseudomonas sp. S32]MBK5004152.1 hypothetical protein [Pseudomonas sp. S32]
MIEAALMGGSLPGPWSSWEFIGSTELLASGSAPVEGTFPPGVEPGDLIIAVMSPRNEGVGTAMATSGWQHWAAGTQDYLCTARYSSGLLAPKWSRGGNNPLFVCVLAFRAPGWTSVSLKAHTSPAVPTNITTRLQNELLLCIGLTPRATRDWAVSMSGAVPAVRQNRLLSPALHVSSANVDFPRSITGISVDALSGDERNLILSAS